MSDNIAFDNFLVTDNLKVAEKWTEDTWEIKKAQQMAPGGAVRIYMHLIKLGSDCLGQ